MALSDLPKKPNIVFLITDQQTSVPFIDDPTWAAANLPAMNRLLKNGLAFERAHCNSCTCSPSRATLFTGMFPAHHKVTQVLEYNQPDNNKQPGQQILPGNYQTMAKMLKAAGYNVAYKGKFHLNKPVGFFPDCVNADDEKDPVINGQLYWSQADVKNIADNYGFDEWSYPDAGDDAAVHNFGGGYFNNDGRFVDGNGQSARYGYNNIPEDEREKASALHYLNHYQEQHGDEPFFLVVSLVNPHDVLSYPGTAQAYVKVENERVPRYIYAGYQDDQFDQIKVNLPSTLNEELTPTKPTVQEKWRQLCQAAGPINSEKDATMYLQFYAYLTSLADKEIMKVLEALDANNFTDNTLIVRISDHGDMAMAHHMQRQKMYNVYRETLNVPMIFSNPMAFPTAQTTQALAGLIDLMPTMADIAGVNTADWTFQGKSLKPVLENPVAEVQDYVHYTYDDDYVTTNTPQDMGANHIRCIVEKEWKYAVYFDPNYGQEAEFEMYDLVNDQEEQYNLAYSTVAEKSTDPAEVEAERERLHNRLTEVMEKLGTKPDTVVWPPDQAPSPEEQKHLGAGTPPTPPNTPAPQSKASSSTLPP
jgi:arylsulfatase A-like enzyme